MKKLIHTALHTLTKGQYLSKASSIKVIDPTTVSMCLTFFWLDRV